VSDHEHRPAGVPGAPATRSRRSARYGQPVSPLGRAAATLCAIVANLCAVSWWALAVWERRNLAVDLDDGVAVGQAALVAADDRVASAGLVMMLAGVVTGIALMVWMYRAYRNVGAWRPIDYGVGWSVVSWFVPFLNLVRPAKIMVEIVEGSRTTGRSAGLVWWWWFAWLLPGFVVGLLGLVDTSAPSDYAFRETLVVVTAVVVAIDAVMLMVIVGRATNDQRSRIAMDAETEAQLADSR